MPDTLAASQITIDQFAAMMQAEFLGRLVIGDLATADNTLEGVPGSVAHFPKFQPLGDAVDLTEAVAMATEALTTADETATIKEIGKAAEISDTALLVAYGDPLAEIRRQFGIVVARKIDVDLTAEAVSAGAFTSTIAANISSDAIADALALFGDDADPADFAALVIHSKQKTDIFKDDDFTRQDTFGPDNPRLRGQIGDIFGIPVVVSDRVQVVTGVPDTYKAMLIKTNALSLLYKRRPIIEQDRDILRRTTVVTTTSHYAVKRVNDRGICVLTTQ